MTRAEEAPLKIYVQVKDGKTITTNRVFDDDICYIHKDALLEWLNERKKLMEEEIGFGLSIDDVIGKINQM